MPRLCLPFPTLTLCVLPFLPPNCRASLEECLVRWFWSPPTGHILSVWKAQPRHIQAIFLLWKPSLTFWSPPLDSRLEMGGFPTVKHGVPSSWWSKSWIPSDCFLFLLESRGQPLQSSGPFRSDHQQGCSGTVFLTESWNASFTSYRKADIWKQVETLSQCLSRVSLSFALAIHPLRNGLKLFSP